MDKPLHEQSEPIDVRRTLAGYVIKSLPKYADLWEPATFLAQPFVQQEDDCFTITLKHMTARYQVVEKNVQGEDWWIAELVWVETPVELCTTIAVTRHIDETGNVTITADQFPEFIWISNELLDNEVDSITLLDEDDFRLQFDNGWATYRRIFDDEDTDRTFCKRVECKIN